MTSAPDISDNDSETLSNISDENMCCVCKKLSLDAMLLLYTVFCPASEKTGPKGPLVTKNWGHLEYMWAIKKIKTKAISITHF